MIHTLHCAARHTAQSAHQVKRYRSANPWRVHHNFFFVHTQILTFFESKLGMVVRCQDGGHDDRSWVMAGLKSWLGMPTPRRRLPRESMKSDDASDCSGTAPAAAEASAATTRTNEAAADGVKLEVKVTEETNKTVETGKMVDSKKMVEAKEEEVVAAVVSEDSDGEADEDAMLKHMVAIAANKQGMRAASMEADDEEEDDIDDDDNDYGDEDEQHEVGRDETWPTSLAITTANVRSTKKRKVRQRRSC